MLKFLFSILTPSTALGAFGALKALSPVNLWVIGILIALLGSTTGLGIATYKIYNRAVAAEAQVATLTKEATERESELIAAKATIQTVTSLAVERAQDATKAAQAAVAAKKIAAQARADRAQAILAAFKPEAKPAGCPSQVLTDGARATFNSMLDAVYFDSSLFNLGDPHVLPAH